MFIISKGSAYDKDAVILIRESTPENLYTVIRRQSEASGEPADPVFFPPTGGKQMHVATKLMSK